MSISPSFAYYQRTSNAAGYKLRTLVTRYSLFLLPSSCTATEVGRGLFFLFFSPFSFRFPFSFDDASGRVALSSTSVLLLSRLLLATPLIFVLYFSNMIIYPLGANALDGHSMPMERRGIIFCASLPLVYSRIFNSSREREQMRRAILHFLIFFFWRHGSYRSG